MTIAETRSLSHAPTDSVGAYLQEIGRVPLLTAAEETDLATRIEVGLLADERRAALARRADPGPTDTAFAEELRWLTADGVRAMSPLICANLRLVVSVARHFTERGLDLLDLIQEGNVGLIRAVQRFDHARRFKFSTPPGGSARRSSAPWPTSPEPFACRPTRSRRSPPSSGYGTVCG